MVNLPATRVIGISVSAGGLAALTQLLGDLPATLTAAILVVQHLQPDHRSHLSEILARRTALVVSEAISGEQLCHGRVYVAPPDLHLLVGIDCRVVLSHLPPLHFCRPSSDRLFASLTTSFCPRAVAVVLTGRGRDGADGAQLVRRHGGSVVVQDPPTAEYGDMPRAALLAGAVDHIVPLGALARTLELLVSSGDQ